MTYILAISNGFFGHNFKLIWHILLKPGDPHILSDILDLPKVSPKHVPTFIYKINCKLGPYLLMHSVCYSVFSVCTGCIMLIEQKDSVC